MNTAKEVFDRDGTEESIVDMDGLSHGSDGGVNSGSGSPGSRFKVDTTTATGDPLDVGSPILSSHSATKSPTPPVLPPPYSPEHRSGTPSRGQILHESPTPPHNSSHIRPEHFSSDDYGNASERDALRGNHFDEDDDDAESEGLKAMNPRPPIITGVPTIELPDGKEQICWTIH